MAVRVRATKNSIATRIWRRGLHIEGKTMSKRKASKHKLDRRMGENIWGRPNSPVNRRSYGPGQHGQRRKSKVSD